LANDIFEDVLQKKRTPDIQGDGLTQPSVVRIIHRDVGLKCPFSYQSDCFLSLLVSVTFIFHKVV